MLTACCFWSLTGLAVADTSGGGAKPHDPHLFGASLPRLGSAGLGPCIDAAVEGARLYTIGRSVLTTWDLGDPQRPQRLGQLGGLGNTRQIEIAGDLAFITAREDGLFVVDVSNPGLPRLVCHYNTIELATGIAVAGPVAYVACRNYGVELVDVRDPAHLRHLSTVRTGEAQSCVVRDGLLYVGVWGTRELVVCDVSDPWRPRVVSKSPLGGFGDGVALHGDLCVVATGHHRDVGRPSPEDPRYGAGHGVEIFRVTDPTRPEHLARVDFPPFYSIYVDYWDVQVSGDLAYVGDTHNGLFVIDIADPAQPRCRGHHQLDLLPGRVLRDPVTGFAIGRGVLYAAGLWSDLHVIGWPAARPPARPAQRPPSIGPEPPASAADWRVYRPDGQVYAACGAADYAWVACGAAGLQQVRLWPEFEVLATYPTAGFAVDVKRRGSALYVAESQGGLSIWQIGATGDLSPRGRFTVPGKAIKQVVAPAGRSDLILDVGANTVQILDASDPAAPRERFHGQQHGLFYGYNLTDGLFEGRYAAGLWHASGVWWIDLAADPPAFTADRLDQPMNTANGLAVLPDGQHGILTTGGDTLAVVDRASRCPLGTAQRRRVPGANLTGKPVIIGDLLFLTDRVSGRVSLLDIHDLATPRLLQTWVLDGHPGLVTAQAGHVLLPAGYAGLWVRPVKP